LAVIVGHLDIVAPDETWFDVRGAATGYLAAVAFRGWPDEAIDFFDGLEVDNSKSYWQEHKDVYDRCVKARMEELLGEMAGEFGAGKVFRPYRDVRFSKDKAPYKTNIAATTAKGSYVSLSAAGLAAGAGMYMMATDQLERYRRAVASEAQGRALEEIAAALEKQGHECTPHGALKTAPRGYPRDHPRIDLLRAKGLTAWHQWEPGPWLSTAKAKTRVVSLLRASEPLKEWLGEHVGDSSLPEPGRR